jgi:hypothetical protein
MNEPTRQQVKDILLKQGFTAETAEKILNGEIKVSEGPSQICAKCADPNAPEYQFGHECSKTAPDGAPCLCDGIHGVLKDGVVTLGEKRDTEAFADSEHVSAAIASAEAPAVSQPPIDPTFSQETCPVCNNEKAQKDDAVEASHKAEMVLVLRDIVGRFKRETDVRLSGLASRVTAQINTIVAASNDLTVTKHDLDLSLIQLEENLKDAFGIKDTLDPTFAGGALFLEDEEGEPLDLFDAPAPGTDAIFDKLSADVDAVLGDNDPTDVESIASQTDQRPFKAGDGAWQN